MGRVVHFEIHVEDMERAKKLYGGGLWLEI